MQILFVGAGNMATALIGGLIQQGTAPQHITVVVRNPNTANTLSKKWPVQIVSSMSATVVAAAKMVVLAVKPQQLKGVTTELAPLLRNQTVLSIAAGVQLATLSQWLGGYSAVVRAMPNTPAVVGLGVTGLYASVELNQEQHDQAQHIMQAVGSVFWLTDDAQMDALTAVSGSGPAYVFYFMEAIQQAAIALGLPAEMAQQLSMQTFAGAIRLAQHSDDSVTDLRRRVTSPGGTTEAAISRMQNDGLAELIQHALFAAAARAKVLGEVLADSSNTLS